MPEWAGGNGNAWKSGKAEKHCKKDTKHIHNFVPYFSQHPVVLAQLNCMAGD